MPDALTIRRPDDMHLHLRDGAMLEAVLPFTTRDFARALVMPNLVPPVVTAADAAEYRDRILAAKSRGSDFRPLMTLYLTEETEPRDVRAAAEIGLVTAVKLYPAGATTYSASGVRDLDQVMRVLETMAQVGLPLCIHGEVTDPEVDIFDREAAFIENVLDPLRRRLPELRIVLEHVTTEDGVRYIGETEKNLAGTLTVHHLVLNRTHLFVGGIRPHYYCLPIAKRELHRLALRRAAVSGDPRFFLGTDSAPHTDAAKETACGCAGCFTASVALPLLAHVFDEEGALDRLEDFASVRGATWYGLPLNDGTVTIRRGSREAAGDKVQTAQGPVTIFDPGFAVGWHVA